MANTSEPINFDFAQFAILKSASAWFLTSAYQCGGEKAGKKSHMHNYVIFVP